MKNSLVDVLNDRGTVLHVFPIAVEDENGAPKAVDPVREALRLAAIMQIVPEAETVHARPHVSRGGPLMPYSDVLETRLQRLDRIERRIRERAYFLWQKEGCPENRADEHWRQAQGFEGNNGSI